MTDTKTLQERLRVSFSEIRAKHSSFEVADHELISSADEERAEAADKLDALEAERDELKADNKQVSDQLEYYSAFADQSAAAILNAKAEAYERCAQVLEDRAKKVRTVVAADAEGQLLGAIDDIRDLKETPDAD